MLADRDQGQDVFIDGLLDGRARGKSHRLPMGKGILLHLTEVSLGIEKGRKKRRFHYGQILTPLHSFQITAQLPGRLEFL